MDILHTLLTYLPSIWALTVYVVFRFNICQLYFNNRTPAFRTRGKPRRGAGPMKTGSHRNLLRKAGPHMARKNGKKPSSRSKSHQRLNTGKSKAIKALEESSQSQQVEVPMLEDDVPFQESQELPVAKQTSTKTKEMADSVSDAASVNFTRAKYITEKAPLIPPRMPQTALSSTAQKILERIRSRFGRTYSEGKTDPYNIKRRQDAGARRESQSSPATTVQEPTSREEISARETETEEQRLQKAFTVNPLKSMSGTESCKCIFRNFLKLLFFWECM